MLYKQIFNVEEDIEFIESNTAILKARQKSKLKRIESLIEFRKNEYSKTFDNKFKRIIKERDGYKCFLCKKEKDLAIHHIDYNKKNTNNFNCITLCVGCNIRVNSKREYWQSYLKNMVHYRLEGQINEKNEY